MDQLRRGCLAATASDANERNMRECWSANSCAPIEQMETQSPVKMFQLPGEESLPSEGS